jgi:hypothetical protein
LLGGYSLGIGIGFIVVLIAAVVNSIPGGIALVAALSPLTPGDSAISLLSAVYQPHDRRDVLGFFFGFFLFVVLAHPKLLQPIRHTIDRIIVLGALGAW